MLSTGTLCGKQGVADGIPALVPARWANREGHDTRPCNDAAQVTFAHKTGLTLNFGSDIGIVRGIPGRARRHYIITFFSNLGHRYADVDKLTERGPCHDLGICYTQRIAGMAATIDAALAAAIETGPDGRE